MTLFEIINTLFPNGYLIYEPIGEDSEQKTVPTSLPGKTPYLCTDMFAIAAVVLQRSGAYHHISSNSRSPAERTLTVNKTDRERWIDLGCQWRESSGPPPQALVALWTEFWNLRGEDIFRTLDPTDPVPAWWNLALALLCIADEAAKGLGFEPPPNRLVSYQRRAIDYATSGSIYDDEEIFTYSKANPDLVCVLPKSRTPSVGSTLRSLTHNLALLPPRGLARAYWLPYIAPKPGAASTPSKPTEEKSLNCLLIPMPYRIDAQSIVGERHKNDDWGWFHVKPRWCDPISDGDADGDIQGFGDFWIFIQALITAAETDVGEVHALVFPELALSESVFLKLSESLKGGNIEILIAGLFDRTERGATTPTKGNYAAMADTESGAIVSRRQKHHRWRLDRPQIQTYSLGASLDPCISWWEEFSITSRSLDIYVLRGTTTVTTLICEDLARHDPCQDLVRGIGPNIVFALLMDGAQLKDRWPSRYATVLAEDPGSSVLSFTSLGLVERTNNSGRFPASRSIGLWRDDQGETRELSLPSDSQALCISLRATPFEEYTIDGRGDGKTAESWRLVGVQPVKIASETPGASSILSGRWPAKTHDPDA